MGERREEERTGTLSWPHRMLATILSGANQPCQLSSFHTNYGRHKRRHAYMSQHRHNKFEAREIRTPNLLIWSQTRCRCAIAPWITIWLASARTFSNTLHKFLNFTYLSAWFASRSGDDIWVQKTLVAMNRILMESTR